MTDTKERAAKELNEIVGLTGKRPLNTFERDEMRRLIEALRQPSAPVGEPEQEDSLWSDAYRVAEKMMAIAEAAPTPEPEGKPCGGTFKLMPQYKCQLPIGHTEEQHCYSEGDAKHGSQVTWGDMVNIPAPASPVVGGKVCKWCDEGNIPEWSPYANVFIHRRDTLDMRCEDQERHQIPSGFLKATRQAFNDGWEARGKASPVVREMQSASSAVLESSRKLNEVVGEQSEIEALEELVRHCWIHSGYKNCGYEQMTTEQKALYNRIVNSEPAAPVMGAGELALKHVAFMCWDFDRHHNTLFRGYDVLKKRLGYLDELRKSETHARHAIAERERSELGEFLAEFEAAYRESARSGEGKEKL